VTHEHAVCFASARGRWPTSILAIVSPSTAFVAAGFEHSIANAYFVPEALLIEQRAPRSFLIGDRRERQHVSKTELATLALYHLTSTVIVTAYDGRAALTLKFGPRIYILNASLVDRLGSRIGPDPVHRTDDEEA
jgi:hypothetical protein